MANSLNFVESDSFNPSFISADDSKLIGGKKPINQLLEQYKNIRREIKKCEMRIESISHYTPLGASAMLLESATDVFFNQHTQLPDFRDYFASFDEETVNVATKLALASAIDASVRQQELYQKLIELRKKADHTLDGMIRLEPQLSCVPHKIVIHKISATKAENKKFTENYKCEFCLKEYAHGSSLIKHLKECHSKHFENSITKYYAIANSCGDPKVLEAINLLKADCLGLETYQVLMDEKLLQLVNQIVNNKSKGAEMESPTPSKKQLFDIDEMEKTELRQLPEKCAANTMGSKLNKHQKEFFSKMVVNAVLMLDDMLPLNVIGIKKVPGGAFEDTFLVAGVAFKKTFSNPGFELQPKQYTNPKIALLNIELDLKSERDNAEVHLDNDEEYQKVVYAEWTILYDELEKIYSSGAKIVLSKLPIGDDASQYFADHDMVCAGNIPEEHIKRTMIACGGSISMNVADLNDSVLGTCQHFEESQIGGDLYVVIVVQVARPGSIRC